MRVRGNRLASSAAVLSLVVGLVAVLGSAQAAPSTKKYSATVHVADGDVTSTSATLTLIVTNKTRSQTLGSAEFKPPAGVRFEAIAAPPTRPGWENPELDLEGGTFTFRSTSNALRFNENVSADVSVSIDQSACNHATKSWETRAKQSNDFSGSPGNDFQFDPVGSDLIALGRFDIATIETVTADGQHVPAILTNVAEDFVPHESKTTAYDICGEKKTNYDGNAELSTTLLTDASFDPPTGLKWNAEVGTVFITPVVTETDNKLTVTDKTSRVEATSKPFDTTDRLCTSQDEDRCEWQDRSGKITVNADQPPRSASLGIGFNSSLGFDCDGALETVGKTPLVNINPHYEAANPPVAAIDVTLTYTKSATGNGPASSFDVCFRKDEWTHWIVLTQCASTPVAPCFLSRKRVTGGELEVVLWVETDDPWTGLG